MCPLWQKLWIVIVKIIKRVKVCGENMTTTSLEWQESRLSKVRGNSGIATQSVTEFTAQRNVIVSLDNYLHTQCTEN
jgi:hypothetical protein